ncbi:MAG: hypothetical protein ACOX2O_03570 [Bdellovibrionota bacterium]
MSTSAELAGKLRRLKGSKKDSRESFKLYGIVKDGALTLSTGDPTKRSLKGGGSFRETIRGSKTFIFGSDNYKVRVLRKGNVFQIILSEWGTRKDSISQRIFPSEWRTLVKVKIILSQSEGNIIPKGQTRENVLQDGELFCLTRNGIVLEVKYW